MLTRFRPSRPLAPVTRTRISGQVPWGLHRPGLSRQLERRYDRLHLLEVNTRFNLWHYLGAKNGVNLPRVAYEFLTLNRRPQRAPARTRYRWLSLRHDLRAYRELSSRGELGLAAWLRSLAYAPMVYALFSWSDPLPFVRYWTQRIGAALSRRVHRWLATAS